MFLQGLRCGSHVQGLELRYDAEVALHVRGKHHLNNLLGRSRANDARREEDTP